MSRAIIGKGTWIDKVGLKVIERQRKLGRYGGVIRTESGLGASGIPHIGSFGDAVRAHAVKLALENLGEKAEFIAFSDDVDGLRRVPQGFPGWLKEYLAFPVSSIPDPFACHGSFGAHMSGLLLDALDRCGVEYRFISGRDAYKKGLLVEQIHKILSHADKVGSIIKEMTGQDKYLKVLPYFPICPRCGRIYTTKAYRYLPDEMKVQFRCEGEISLKGIVVTGCGYEGEADIRDGEGKLSWKGEFAARWAALGIAYEAYGKDIADSVRVNDRISEEVLGYPPPLHVRYELFLDKTGKKISKSVGNVLTPQIWFKYGSPQSLVLLMLKRSVGTRTISITPPYDDIPAYMTELDTLEDIYFDRKPVGDLREKAKLNGLYEYVWLLKPPKEPDVHVPYNLLTYLAKVAPKGKEVEYSLQKIKEYGYLKGEAPRSLLERINYAINWVNSFPEQRMPIPLMREAEKAALKDIIQEIRKNPDPEALQGAIFEKARGHGIEPSEFFKLLYMILIGSPKGPRLGPYMKAMGYDNVIRLLEAALEQKPFSGGLPASSGSRLIHEL